MDYLEIKIKLNNEFSEYFADILLEKGALSVSIEDAFAHTQWETPLYDETNVFQIWNNTLVIALFNYNTNVDIIINDTLEKLGVDENINYEINELENEDWVKKNHSSFEAIKISENLWIVPSWADILDSNAINVRIDPGLAFGTGAHSTTSLCLNLLSKYIKVGDSVLDYGCGSGILSIASKKLGAKKVVGVDIDILAVKTSKENAIINNEKIDFYLPDDRRINYNYDIVVANILTNSLRILSNLLVNYVKQEGYLILSGILEIQEKEIKEIYLKWFDFIEILHKDGWVCILGKKY